MCYGLAIVSITGIVARRQKAPHPPDSANQSLLMATAAVGAPAIYILKLSMLTLARFSPACRCYCWSISARTLLRLCNRVSTVCAVSRGSIVWMLATIKSKRFLLDRCRVSSSFFLLETNLNFLSSHPKSMWQMSWLANRTSVRESHTHKRHLLRLTGTNPCLDADYASIRGGAYLSIPQEKS